MKSASPERGNVSFLSLFGFVAPPFASLLGFRSRTSTPFFFFFVGLGSLVSLGIIYISARTPRICARPAYGTKRGTVIIANMVIISKLRAQKATGVNFKLLESSRNISPFCRETKAGQAPFLPVNNALRRRVKKYMKKIGAVVVAALLWPYAVGSADAEGPLHWTARHVGQAAVETGDTLSNVARTTARTIHHRTRPVRQAFR